MSRELIEKILKGEVLFQHVIEINEMLKFESHFITKMWDLFRLTDSECLEKFPDNEHIKKRNPELPIVNEELYKRISKFFKILILLKSDRALLLKFFNLECPDIIIYIDDKKEITIMEFVGLTTGLESEFPSCCVLMNVIQVEK